MRRRDILSGAGSLAAGATLSFPVPAIAQGIRQLKMVTDWPAGSPGLQSSAARLAQRIGTASDGRINIEVFPAGALVRPFETFDAVGAGVADMYHSADYYFEKKSPAFNFFSTVPFGFTADELFAWVQYGGGQELWDTLSGQFNIKPLLCLCGALILKPGQAISHPSRRDRCLRIQSRVRQDGEYGIKFLAVQPAQAAGQEVAKPLLGKIAVVALNSHVRRVINFHCRQLCRLRFAKGGYALNRLRVLFGLRRLTSS